MQQQRLLERLRAIGNSLAATGEAVALLGLGSAGAETDRMDRYSDLDFFVIARPGSKERFTQELDWLESVTPLAYRFRNTKDGYKLFFADGIYAEMAVFEPEELAQIPYAEGRVVWRAPDFAAEIAKPSRPKTPWRAESLDWALNEALTCLYAGLCRFARGERLSGARFVQNYAIDILISALPLIEEPHPSRVDPFQNERRIEQRHPDFGRLLPQMVQGYERTPESALVILEYLERIGEVSPFVADRVRSVAAEAARRQ